MKGVVLARLLLLVIDAGTDTVAWLSIDCGQLTCEEISELTER